MSRGYNLHRRGLPGMKVGAGEGRGCGQGCSVDEHLHMAATMTAHRCTSRTRTGIMRVLVSKRQTSKDEKSKILLWSSRQRHPGSRTELVVCFQQIHRVEGIMGVFIVSVVGQVLVHKYRWLSFRVLMRTGVARTCRYRSGNRFYRFLRGL
ncbi:hypothetical protein BD779DRAFT_205524 [Infundibulicybe gibba]|nr:hypothetical protein BD779DRAFT_205524 [Infundibulicybe gibba]